MRFSKFNYFPLAISFIAVLLFLFLFLFTLIQIGLLEYAYEKIGIEPRYIFGILLLSLFGSCINIPVAKLSTKKMRYDQEVTFFGIRYVIPSLQEWSHTVLASNVGGAIIPTLLSLYLLVKFDMYIRGLVGVVIVTVVVHWLARPVKGVGIAVPVIIPPLVAAAWHSCFPGSWLLPWPISPEPWEP